MSWLDDILDRVLDDPSPNPVDLHAILDRVLTDPRLLPADLERLALVRAQHFAPTRLRGIDLFAGAGGFTIGALQRNCSVIGIERQQKAVRSSRQAGHDVLRMDVQEAAARTPGLRMDLLIGGPPCQPFSSSGQGRGKYDPREGFGLALRAVDAWEPTRVVLENVRAFLADRHRSYRNEILAALRGRYAHVGWWLLNAADYGVPQDRKRVFIWAAEVPLTPPPPTHGPGTGRPFVTVRQALPHLMREGFEALMSFETTAISRSIDHPSPTVKAVRNLYAVTRQGFTYRGAGSVPKKQRRILYPPEVQALQSFPATFGFYGTLKDQAMQIGNAVPPLLAVAVMGAAAAGLRPRPITPTELLDSFGRMDESIFVVEPRPWSDAALIGVTTMKAGSEGMLIPVYDASKLKDAIIDAATELTAEQKGKRIDQLTDADRQEAFNWAMDWSSNARSWNPPPPQDRCSQCGARLAQGGDVCGCQRQDSWTPPFAPPARPDECRLAPITVPVQTLKELGLPIATMLMPQDQAIHILEEAAARQARKPGYEPEPWLALLQVLAQHNENV